MTHTFILVRHGETLWNTQKRFQGHGDSPLTDLGREQARRHAMLLETLHPQAIVASPLPRAAETARAIAERLGLGVAFDDGLMERSMGAFDGWSLEELGAHAPEAWAARAADPWQYRAPGGENYEDLRTRLVPLVKRLRERPEARLAVVSHGTLGRALTRELLELSPAQTLRMRQPNDVVYEVRLGGGRPGVFHYRDGERREGLLEASPSG